MAPSPSLWQETRTFFPIFLDLVVNRGMQSVCVVGASDGKFVLPLARLGVRVLAVERNKSALDGGPVVLPGRTEASMPGLRKRLADEDLSGRVEIVEADILDLPDELDATDAVWTSCSWHYSINHRRPLGDFIAAMKRSCRPRGGVFAAEYMMPVEPWHLACEHYPEEGEMRRFFPDWAIEWETYTPPFLEAPHVEQLHEHTHRMGLLIATNQQKGCDAD
ncbi:class I SAM-dependent methyltransferase [Streptomyces nigrescens]|uniref:Class I SAM-dependent methyltransferase n=1 Tax=Streptomyces nigrescens TaxID=1920 RepID=A0ABY7IYX5_STRNI|nr:class I SAM-dependent methyltransferase [Streptomyces nigrescens]WAU03999.1 class I SAM-dependent methyltransferase [Streptomyces nigrescens]